MALYGWEYDGGYGRLYCVMGRLCGPHHEHPAVPHKTLGRTYTGCSAEDKTVLLLTLGPGLDAQRFTDNQDWELYQAYWKTPSETPRSSAAVAAPSAADPFYVLRQLVLWGRGQSALHIKDIVQDAEKAMKDAGLGV